MPGSENSIARFWRAVTKQETKLYILENLVQYVSAEKILTGSSFYYLA